MNNIFSSYETFDRPCLCCCRTIDMIGAEPPTIQKVNIVEDALVEGFNILLILVAAAFISHSITTSYGDQVSIPQSSILFRSSFSLYQQSKAFSSSFIYLLTL